MTESAPTIRVLGSDDYRAAVLRVRHGFVRHRGIDAAAALAYWAALTIFPGLLAVVSTLALANGSGGATALLLTIVDEFGSDATVETLRDPLAQLLTLPNAAVGLAVGLLLSLWTISGYATAAGRAINAVYEVHEGRRPVILRLRMLGLALALLPLIATLVALLLSTPRAVTAVGDSLRIGEPWLSVWTLGRWPILVLLFGVLVAALYYLTPNLRHERVRWVTLGAAFTVVVWMTATGLFALYVATVGQYDRVYGWLGGGLVLLLWLWISNLVLVLGAEVDAELVRARQLGAGMPAEEAILLPARDTSRTLLLARHRADDLHRARALRDLPRDPSSGPS